MGRLRGGTGKRKLWKVTIKIPQLYHPKTREPIDLGVNEWSFETLGYNAGVAIQRAFPFLRDELKGMTYKQCVVFARVLYKYTRKMEQDEIEEAKRDICPCCSKDIAPLGKGSPEWIAHQTGECLVKRWGIDPSHDLPEEYESWEDYIKQGGYEKYGIEPPPSAKKGIK